MALNHKVKGFRISEQTHKLLCEASEGLGLSQTDLVRFLLVRALAELKASSVRAGGFDNLNIAVRETNGNK